ncbi:MAG: signal peptidase II [Rhizobiaceae bacterium]|nr:signal peptidase II [Rhizobiaceae bacterium]
MRALPAYGLLTVAAVAVDQWIKWLVQSRMAMGETIEFLPFLAWHRTVNTGISFSFMDGLPAWVLAALALAVMGFILWLAIRTEPRQVFARAGFALIVGGAVGNLIDRVLLGHVVDYVYFHTPVWSFAVFNLADTCITVGAVLVILQEVVDWRRDRAAKQES